MEKCVPGHISLGERLEVWVEMEKGRVEAEHVLRKGGLGDTIREGSPWQCQGEADPRKWII